MDPVRAFQSPAKEKWFGLLLIRKGEYTKIAIPYTHLLWSKSDWTCQMCPGWHCPLIMLKASKWRILHLLVPPTTVFSPSCNSFMQVLFWFLQPRAATPRLPSLGLATPWLFHFFVPTPPLLTNHHYQTKVLHYTE